MELDERPLAASQVASSERTEGHPAITSYVRAIQTGKHHLGVCLKLLGIMCRNDDDSPLQDRSDESRQVSTVDDQNLIWPSESRGDGLYLAMVMLNSALLKALHVTDSFQLHCHREFPRIAPPQEDSPTLCDEEGWRHLSDEHKITCEEYRRRQAECFVLYETAWSLEQQRESDKARIRQLEDECRQIRAAISKPPEEPVATAPTRPEPQEIDELRDFGIGLQWQSKGSAVIPENELQQLVSVFQGLTRSVQEERPCLAQGKQRAADEAKAVMEGEQQRDEARKTLFGAGTPQGSLQSSLRHLLSDLSRAEATKRRRDHEREVWTQLQDLHAQGAEVERQCQDLSMENSKLQQAMGDGGNGGVSGIGSGSSMQELLKEYDEACARSEATPQSSSRRGTASSGQRGGGPGQGQKHRAVAAAENGFGEGPEPPDNDSVTTVSESAGLEPRHTGRGNRTGSHRTQNQKPFVVCSSSRSHHASASHTRTRGNKALLEERMFAKAAVRYAKNPADVQALGKLASLWQRGGIGQATDARVSEPSASADASPEWCRPRVPEADAGGGIPVSYPSPPAKSAPATVESSDAGAAQSDSRHAARSTSPHSAARMAPARANSELLTQRLLMQLGKARGAQNAWPPGTAPARGVSGGRNTS